MLISPEWLLEGELVRAADCAGATFSPATVDFDAVTRFKYALLETAWKNFRAGARPDLRADFEQFVHEHSHWLDDYALFRALKARYDGAGHLEWPDDLIRRTPAALDQARGDLVRASWIAFGSFSSCCSGRARA